MKKQSHPKTLSGLRLLFFALMLTMLTLNASAQNNPPHPPVPAHPVEHHHMADSIILAHLNSAWAHHQHDTVPPTPRPKPRPDSIPGGGHRDTLVLHPHGPDSIGRPHHDSLPPLPNCHRDTTRGGHDGDTTRPIPPTPPIDTNRHNGDTTHHVPPTPPIPPVDTTWQGGGHDTTGHNHPPVPPAPPVDSNNTGGGVPSDTTHPHHKDLYLGPDNTPASLLVFPNPVFESATLRIQNTNSTVTFQLYEATGRMVMVKANLTNGDYTITKGNLSPGIYFYEMIDGNTIASKGSIIIH